MTGSRIEDSDDSLASSFVSSFSLPPPSPKDQPEKNTEGPPTVELDEEKEKEEAAQAERDEKTADKEEESPTPAQEAGQDWKAALDENLVAWRAESSVAREKSEAMRKRLEDEKADAEKKVVEDKKAAQRKKQQEEDDKEVERKLGELLNAPSPAAGSKATQKRKSDKKQEEKERKRWNAVRDAWEIVKDGSGAQLDKEELEETVEVDSRDLIQGDQGGKDQASGSKGADVLKQAHEAITQISEGDAVKTEETLHGRASMLAAGEKPESSSTDSSTTDNSSSEKLVDSEDSQTQNDDSPVPSTTTQSTEEPEASAPTVSSSTTSVPSKTEDREEEKVEIGPIPTPSPLSGPPYQPPSLTLSLFTSPSHRSIARIAAVIGINLVLPFINGVMLGFGEIFARETVVFGRRWWRGEASLRSLWRPSASGNFAGLGLDTFGGSGA